MPVSEIVRRALQYKTALDGRTGYQYLQMRDYWIAVRSSLYSQAQTVAQEILERFPDGGASMQWVRELDYYRALTEQADNVIAQYGSWGQTYTLQQVLDEYRISADEAVNLINIERTQGMGYFKGLARPQLEMMAGFAQADAPLGKLFAGIGEGAREQLTASLMEGLAKGMPNKKIAELMVSNFNIPFVRANLIARTEVNRAHRASSLETYQNHKIRRFKRMASKQRACMACLMLDGQIYTSEHELDDHPNGACVMVPWVDGADEPTWDYGKDYFMGLSEEEQRKRMGNAYYEAWQRGDYQLDDLARIQKNRVWGGSPQVVPLKELSPDWKSWFYGGEIKENDG